MARLAKEQIATTAPVVDLRGRGVGGSPLTALQEHQINVFGQPPAKPLTCPTHDVPFKPRIHFELVAADRLLDANQSAGTAGGLTCIGPIRPIVQTME
jgi:hypothetical protein